MQHGAQAHAPDGSGRQRQIGPKRFQRQAGRIALLRADKARGARTRFPCLPGAGRVAHAFGAKGVGGPAAIEREVELAVFAAAFAALAFKD